MNAHLRANLWLLGLTVLLCCVLYPLTLWAAGRGLFPDKASGSLIDRDGKPTPDETKWIGSRLIAQPFSAPEYFQPRPSSPSYDASSSGGSNLSANNPKLRARVAQTLGPIVKYRSGPKKDQPVGPDIVQWFRQKQFKDKPPLPATSNPEIQRNYFEMWLQEHPDVELVQVPADMVMASGSGLDPHITLANARYQLDRVAAAWADKTKADPAEVRKAIGELLNRQAEAPFGGLLGVELINVLDVNRMLPDVIGKLPRRAAGGGGPA
jgi:K+-transporting ATPase c subunit